MARKISDYSVTGLRPRPIGARKENKKMFENEVQAILGKYKESTKLVNKLNEIYSPYDYSGNKRDDIFYLDIRIESAESVKNRAFNQMNNIIKEHELKYPDGIKQEYKTPQELANVIKKFNIQDFFNSLTYYVAFNNRYDYEFSKNRYIEARSYNSRNCLILECILLLVTGETINREMRYNISKVDAGTFLFCGCKVQVFKNGKIIIDFSSLNLFERFKKQYEKGVKLSKIRYGK